MATSSLLGGVLQSRRARGEFGAVRGRHSVPSGGGVAPFLLRGTLTLPNGSGPLPGVVLVHGSGSHDRKETVAAHRPFKDIAEGLSSRGVAVLRYDKRTYAHQK